MKTNNTEKQILITSLVIGSILALSEFIMAFITKSQAVLADAAYDSTDMIVAAITLFLVPLYSKPISEKRPFGFLQIESVFVALRSFMLLSISIGLATNSIQIILNGGNDIDANSISIMQLILCFINLFVFIILKRKNDKISSPTSDLEVYGWKLDVFYSFGMFLAFAVAKFLNNTSLSFILPYFDQIIAILITILMLPESFKILHEGIRNIFLFAPDKKVTNVIKKCVLDNVKEYGSDINIVFFDIIKTGRKIWVSAYFKSNKDTISIPKLEELNHKCSSCLKEQFEDIYLEIIPEITRE